MTDPILQALHRAILEEPLVDLHRLAYADRCEELGHDNSRAEFIRVQIELTRLEAVLASPYLDQDLCTEESANWCPVCGDCCCPEPETAKCDPRCPLHAWSSRHSSDDAPRAVLADIREHEKKLWAEAADRSLQLDEPLWGLPAWHVAGWSPNRLHLVNLRQELHQDIYVIFRRGFLEEIHLRCSQFMEKAKDYFLHHPILVVRLIDRKPQDNSDYHPHPWDDRCVVSWHRIVPDYGTESDDLPISLWEHLRGTTENRYKFYSSVESANEALSHACVAYGRKLAVLPPLEV